MKGSRFAQVGEIQTLAFQEVLSRLEGIQNQYDLPDFRPVNLERYPWSKALQTGSEMYASRLWEYPFAILEGQPEGKTCVDVGCGMSPFTLYLRDISKEVIGVDTDLKPSGSKGPAFGVTEDYLGSTGLRIFKSTKYLVSEYFDLVFCISVVEHIPRKDIHKLIQEMTRILKPGGKLVVTLDVNIHYDMARPLELIWDSGLIPVGNLELHWPHQRFGKAKDTRFSADVYGLVLEKPSDYIAEHYSEYYKGDIRQTDIPLIRKTSEGKVFPPLRLRRWVKAEFLGR